jgi:hypothetical protein
MMKKFVVCGLVGLIFILGGCLPFSFTPQVQPGVGETLAAYTMVAVLTQSSLGTLQAQLATPIPDLPTVDESEIPSQVPDIAEPELAKNIPSCVTATPATVCPTSTSTPALKTTTPVPSILPPTPTATVIVGKLCNAAKFIKDITVPDNTIFLPNTPFTKIWRLQNTGTCTWDTGYSLIYDSGNQMQGPASVSLKSPVKPGEMVDVSVDLFAPNWPATYIGYWKLKSADGQKFGIGSTANGVFFVKIISDRTVNYTMIFTDVYCSATWTSSTGKRACPSPTSLTNGSIMRVANFTEEGGAWKQIPGLITVPSDGNNGYLSGVFPPYQVQQGDHIVTTIGCLQGYPKCDISFQIGYIDMDGVTHTLFEPKGQTEDNLTEDLDIDISSLKNTAVQFILTVTNNGTSTDDFGFWYYPVVARAK